MKRPLYPAFFLYVMAVLVSGCELSRQAIDTMSAQNAPLSEAAWIHNAQPIEYEGELWFPTREVESLMDEEVFKVGVYRDVPFFIDRRDIRPYERLYTYFGRNRYRAFEKRP
jgi:hypothetical protein